MAQLLSGTRIYGTGTVDTRLLVVGTGISTSTTTGALIVTGGTGIGGNLYVGGTIYGNLTGVVSTATFAITANSATNIIGGSTGSVFYQSSTNTTVALAIGADAFVLASNGTVPVWSSLTALGAGSATTSTNIAGGTLGQIPYQTGTGLTSFFGPGSNGQFLMSTGASAPIYQSTLTQSNGSIIVNGATATTSTTLGWALSRQLQL